MCVRIFGVLTTVEAKLLQRFFPGGRDGGEAESHSKAAKRLGESFLAGIAGKTVIDFGCGDGAEAIEFALRGAERVIGIDIREEMLGLARQRAREAGVSDICSFMQSAQERGDIIVSLDAFEHFAEPAAVLQVMDSLLKPDGEVLASFGPTWYHPLGGHLFSVFPWAHLLLSEKALIRWRSGFKTDGATRFGEVAGGLNQMTLRRFEGIVAQSPFQFASLEAVPIRKLRWAHNRLTREFTTALVRCRLAKRGRQGPRHGGVNIARAGRTRNVGLAT